MLARCGFNHSINYRAVMAFGRAAPIDGTAAKLRAMDRFIDRFFPGRAGALRPPTAEGDQGDDAGGDADRGRLGQDPRRRRA